VATLGTYLSPEARTDLIDILRYTGEKWGQEQLFTYRDRLNAALLSIEHNPQIGRLGAAPPTPHRIYYIGVHVIVYRINNTAIEVIRILHQRMSLARHL
jgi:toxin ParE1/3/4